MSLLRVARCSYWWSGAASAIVSEQTSPLENSADRYQPQFEGLRALAVLTVMVDHFGADVPNFPCRIGSISARPGCGFFSF